MCVFVMYTLVCRLGLQCRYLAVCCAGVGSRRMRSGEQSATRMAARCFCAITSNGTRVYGRCWLNMSLPLCACVEYSNGQDVGTIGLIAGWSKREKAAGHGDPTEIQNPQAGWCAYGLTL